jgi:hypothetical protein
METWIRRAVRQRALRQLWLWLICTALVAVCLYYSRIYWNNFFQGPYDLSVDQLDAPLDSGKEFVAVTGERVFPSGIQTVTTHTRNGVKESSEVTSAYYLLVMDHRRILIVDSRTSPSTTVSGEIKWLPEELVAQIFPNADDAKMRAATYPFYMSAAEDYRIPGYWTIGCLAIYLTAMLYFGRRAWRFVENPALHPVVSRVESWSDAMAITVMSEREMEQAVRFKGSQVTITDNFLIKRTFLSFNMFPLGHLLWAYKKETLRMINFIPVGKTREAVLVFYGGQVELPSRKKRVEEVLNYVASKAPWAIVGYSEELNSAFKKDASGFYAAVEERRAALSS